MAKITEHTELAAADGDDVLVIVDLQAEPDTTKKIKASSLVDSNAAVAANSAHSAGDGSDHADVATNSAHSSGSGSDHADVATNSAHSSGSGSDHAAVATNSAHSSGDGSDHADVVLNNAHRAASGNPHGADSGDIPEGSNLYHTEARVRAASSALLARTSYEGSSANPSRDNTAYILLEGMSHTFTPDADNNLTVVKFDGSFEGVDKDVVVIVGVFLNSVLVPNSERHLNVKNGKPQSVSLERSVSPTPSVSNAIEIRWKTDGTNLGAVAIENDRRMTIEEWRM